MTPAIFLGHGNPMNAVERNRYSEAWRRIGERIAKPRAVLAISAHWYIPRTAATVNAAPATIHDFGGFPRELYEVEYPAPGDPELARRVARAVGAQLDESWGLDHGTWSVLRHVFPEADVPVVQLSVDESKPAAFHFELGKRLAPLRDEGVLIVASGNVVHNLYAYKWGVREAAPYDWAVRFEERARESMLAGEFEALVDYEALGVEAALSVPTPEHYLPLLYVLGTMQQGEAITFPVEGIEGGSVSMLGVEISRD